MTNDLAPITALFQYGYEYVLVQAVRLSGCSECSLSQYDLLDTSKHERQLASRAGGQ
jgi:hypothetical protein